MDMIHLMPSAPALVQCPQCGHEDVDDYELVEPNMLHEMRCIECAARFHFATMECLACGCEWQFASSREQVAPIDDLACPGCGRSHVQHEAVPGKNVLSI